MHYAAMLRETRALGEAATAREYVEACLELLGRYLPGDRTAWVESDYAGGGSTVLVDGRMVPDERLSDRVTAAGPEHPVVASYVADPPDLTPRRLSDVGRYRRTTDGRVADAATDALGAHQLSLIVSVQGLTGRGWVIGRDHRDFTDDEITVACWLLPALTAYDRIYRPPVRRAPERSLTPREVETLELLAQGLTAAAIGHRLGISPRTVAKHLENAYEKLGRHDRLLAVQQATALAIVQPRLGG